MTGTLGRSSSVPAVRSVDPPVAPSSTAGAVALSAADQALRRMTVDQRVGQLFMAGCSANSDCTDVHALAASGSVGAVILMDNSYRTRDQIRTLIDRLRSVHASGARLFMATDQEGGQVQRLRGSGFDKIPAATVQGQLPADELRRRAQRWGHQLAAAGINLNLAPVLDTVPAGSTATNAPIGALQREFGSIASVVRRAGVAVVDGYREAGIDAAVKHFPGLGRVRGNTDTETGVRDTVTSATDPYLEPFRAAIDDDVAFVMVSTAIYTRIDAEHPAAFSSSVVTKLLRGRLGFPGVVISDDLANAAQVSYLSAGQRAVAFLHAGGDMVLTVDSALVPAMTSAIRARMRTDPAFTSKVDASVRRILRAKQNRGLLTSG